MENHSLFKNVSKGDLQKKYIIDFSKEKKKKTMNRYSYEKINPKYFSSKKDSSMALISYKNSTLGSRIDKKVNLKKK